MDELLTKIKAPNHPVAFADDFANLVGGNDLKEIVMEAQETIDEAIQWGINNGLEFNPKKSQMILFTRRRKFEMPDKLSVNGVQVEYQNSVTYLGVELCDNLRWEKHITKKCVKAKTLLMWAKRFVGINWGLNPQRALWTYTMVARPTVTYGAIAWANRWSESNKRKLNSLQRLGCLMVTTPAPSAPTKGLEAILDLQPLWLYASQLGARAWARIRNNHPPLWDGLPKKSQSNEPRIGHQKFWSDVLEKADVPNNSDERQWYGLWEEIPISLETIANNYPYAAYTDGSKFDEGTGAAWIISEMDHIISGGSYHLGNESSIFQAEALALLKLANYLCEWFHMYKTGITIYSDSKSVLQALMNSEGNSQIIYECKRQFIKAINLGVPIRISWIKAHNNNTGNELCDTFAKLAAKNKNSTIRVEIPIPKSLVKAKVKRYYDQIWDNLWKNMTTCRQTRAFIPSVPAKIRAIKSLSRSEMRLLALTITGHAYVQYHKFKQDNTQPKECRLCGVAVESTWHLMVECPALEVTRRSSPLMANFDVENGINKSDTGDLAFMVLEMSKSKNFVNLVSNPKGMEMETTDDEWEMDSENQ